jgi:peptidoglycan hydrolase-like protein with peptidoglycan-binding domain
MNIKILIGSVFSILLFSASIASADTYSASIQNLQPGATVLAKNKVTFTLTGIGFVGQVFQISDSFSGSTVSANNFDGGGNFQWVPLVNDVGTHNLTLTVRDFNDRVATINQTITVLPPPGVSISNVSATAIKAGQKFTFFVSQNGFTNPTFVVGDAFGGSSAGNQNIDSAGNFSWTPDLSQNGKHTITVYATDSLGHGAQASVDVQVGAGPTLLVQPVTPGTIVNAGETVSFTVGALNFLPTGFSVTDSFSGSTVSNANINTSGNFVWTPSGSDVGTHVFTFLGKVGAFGDSATTSQKIVVVGMGASTTSLPVSTPNTSTSNTSSSTLLATLQAQLAALTAKIGSTAGATSPASNETPVTFTLYLKPGSEGSEVTALQKFLIQKGYLNGEATGYYGSKTVDAVVKLQAANGLTQLGVVGPATRALLNSLVGNTVQSAPSNVTISTGSSGFKFQHFMGFGDDDDPDVTELQKRLKSLGYLSVEPTGFYGNATVAAVKKFQSANSLPVTGYVNKETRTVLNRL